MMMMAVWLTDWLDGWPRKRQSTDTSWPQNLQLNKQLVSFPGHLHTLMGDDKKQGTINHRGHLNKSIRPESCVIIDKQLKMRVFHTVCLSIIQRTIIELELQATLGAVGLSASQLCQHWHSNRTYKQSIVMINTMATSHELIVTLILVTCLWRILISFPRLICRPKACPRIYYLALSEHCLHCVPVSFPFSAIPISQLYTQWWSFLSTSCSR